MSYIKAKQFILRQSKLSDFYKATKALRIKVEDGKRGIYHSDPAKCHALPLSLIPLMSE